MKTINFTILVVSLIGSQAGSTFAQDQLETRLGQHTYKCNDARCKYFMTYPQPGQCHLYKCNDARCKDFMQYHKGSHSTSQLIGDNLAPQTSDSEDGLSIFLNADADSSDILELEGGSITIQGPDSGSTYRVQRVRASRYNALNELNVTLWTSAGTLNLYLPGRHSSCRLQSSTSNYKGAGHGVFAMSSQTFDSWDSFSKQYDDLGSGTGTASYSISGSSISGSFNFRGQRRLGDGVAWLRFSGSFSSVPLD